MNNCLVTIVSITSNYSNFFVVDRIRSGIRSRSISGGSNVAQVVLVLEVGDQ